MKTKKRSVCPRQDGHDAQCRRQGAWEQAVRTQPEQTETCQRAEALATMSFFVRWLRRDCWVVGGACERSTGGSDWPVCRLARFAWPRQQPGRQEEAALRRQFHVQKPRSNCPPPPRPPSLLPPPSRLPRAAFTMVSWKLSSLLLLSLRALGASAAIEVRLVDAGGP